MDWNDPDDPFLRWLADRGNSRNTLVAYHYKVLAFRRWLNGRTVTEALLREYGRELKERGRRPRTRRVVLAALTNWLAWQVETGKLARKRCPNAKALDVGRLDPAIQRTATADQVARIWQAARELPERTEYERYVRARALTLLGVGTYTGLRQHEIAALELRDLHRDSDPWRLAVRIAKGAETSWIRVHTELRPLLETWLPIRAAFAADHHHKTESLWPVDRVRRLSKRGMEDLMRQLCRLAKVPSVGWHSLRHYGISAVARVEDVKTAQAFARHSDVATTYKYLQTDAEKVARGIEAIRVGAPGTVAPAGAQAPPVGPTRVSPAERHRAGRLQRHRKGHVRGG